MKKTIFFVRIFDISPCVFTQIQSGRARWMWNLIPHPTSMSSSHFFQVFLIFGVAGPVKSIPSGYLLDAEFNFTSNKLSRSKFE